jgi:hypothetical protein
VDEKYLKMGIKTRSMSKLPTAASPILYSDEDKDEDEDDDEISFISTTTEATVTTSQSDDAYHETEEDESCSDPSPIRHSQPRRAVLEWLRTIRKSGGYQLTSIRSRVGVCFLCNQVKTLSQRITFGEQTLDCGRHCAQRVALACPKQRKESIQL